MPYNMGDAVGYIKLNIQDFQKKFEEVHSKTESLDKAASGMSDIFKAAGKAVAAAFAGISAAAAAATKSVITVGSSFQASMSQVAATMGMTADQIRNGSEDYERLAETAKEMGATTKFSATQAADALNYLALAGYSVDESISTLPKVLDVAAAGGMDLARASDMVTDAMSALGLPLEEAGTFVDKLAKTSQKSNTSVAQLGEAILQIGGTAKSLAGGVTELDTALGILANNGIKAAEGGTALRQVILNLTAPTNQAKEFMDSLGLSAYDVYGNMKPLNQIFSELSQIMQGMTQQQRDNVLTQIFDARQLKSARALLAGYSESWNDLYEQIEHADGAAHNMALTMQENLTGAITIAKSAIEGVQVTAFEALETGLTKSVKAATASIDELNKKLQTPEMQEALQKIGTMLGDILAKFAEFIANEAIPKMIEWFAKLDETANEVKSVLAGVGAALPIVTFGLIACNQSVQAFVASQIAMKTVTLAANAALLANPFTAVAVAVGALISAFANYNLEMKRAIESARQQETEFTKSAEAINKNAEALKEAKQQAQENVDSINEQNNNLKTLVNELGEFAKKTELSNSELALAQEIITKLNEIYPENTAYIEDGQIKAYDELAISVDEYCKKLEKQAKLEAETNIYLAEKEAYETAKKNVDELAEAVNKTGDEYRKANKERRYYEEGGLFSQNYTMRAKKEADAMGMTLKQYYRYKEELANENHEAAKEAWEKNQEILTETQESYENAQKNIDDILSEGNQNLVSTVEQNGEELKRVYTSQAEAQIDINKKYAKERANQDKKTANEQKKATEKMWQEIEDLDRKYKLGQIENEEDYQEQRKKILESNRLEYDDKWVDEYSKSIEYEKELYQEELDNLEEQKNERKQKSEELQSQREQETRDLIEDLKYRNQIDETYTEQMMYDDMEAIIKGLDKNSALYKEYNKEIVLGRKGLNDELNQIREQEIEDQIEDLKYRNEIDESYTKEMMYNDMQIIIDGLDKNSEIYKKYNKVIISGRKELNDELKDNAETAFQTWTDSYNNLVSEAESAYSEIEKKQDDLSRSMINSVKLYETETKKVWNAQKRAWEDTEVLTASSASIKKQTEELENYTKTLEDLENKGLSDDLMQKVLSMNQAEGAEFAAALNQMSETELQNYVAAYDELVAKSKEFSEQYYSSQIEALDKDFKQKFETLYSQIPADIQLVGQESIDGFIQGVKEKSEDSAKGLQEVMLSGVDAVNNALKINSSKSMVFETIGKNSMLGFVSGLSGVFQSTAEKFSDIGKKCGDEFSNSFKSVWDKFRESLANSISDLSKIKIDLSGINSTNLNYDLSGQYKPQSRQTQQQQSTIIQASQQKTLTVKDVETAIKNAMPSGDVVLKVDGAAFGRISRRELNRLAQSSGNLNLNV